MTTIAEQACGDFVAWLGSPVVSVSLVRRNNLWYASADDFSIAGVGKTEADAYRDVAGLVDAYLRSCYADGLPYDKALRPEPAPSSLRQAAERLLRTALSRIQGRERVLVVPSALRLSL